VKRRRFILSSISAAVVGGALATDACSSNTIATKFNPPSPISNVHTLTVQYATTDIAGYKLRTRTYNGLTHGPTIETRPGETLSFNIVNKLPPNPPEHYPAGSVAIPLIRNEMEAMGLLGPRLTQPSGKIDPNNNPHGFNTTNLHVHGIQTFPHLFSPLGTSDPSAMMLEIAPGESFRYNFTVPSDHPSGLYWYHPHKHGSTDVQVSGGMAGLIVMRGPIDDVPEIAAAREIFMVMQSLEVNRAPGPAPLYDREYVAYKTPAQGGYLGFTKYTMFTLNGRGIYWVDNSTPKKNTYTQLDLPEFSLAPGEVVRLRFLNGANQLTMLLALEGFEVWQIGFDGVNLLAPALKDMSGAGVTTITPENYLSLPIQVFSPANRLELLLRAPAQPGSYVLKSLGSALISGLGHTPDTMELMRFVVGGSPVNMGIPKALPKPAREYPLVSDAEIVARRSFLFNIAPSKVLLTGFEFTINGELYEMLKCPTEVRVGTCEEWRIENADVLEPHPFHIHTNSFQLIAINDEPVDPVQIWDTFPIPPKSKKTAKNGSISVRIRFKEWTGKDVFHCHVLDHEDTGMMRNFLIR
jgi:suppressor of ftsI